jgi:hypothetical protein
MSIIITNNGDVKTPDGIHEYTLRINRDYVCSFKHLRERGLSACLRAAADANDERNRLAELKMIEQLCTMAEARNGI